MKQLLTLITALLLAHTIFAQTKVFKEVGEEISTQVKAITQDNVLVGYLAFTRLEKADADSFNYRISVMDENLNDIGTLNFKQENLELQGVSFEQDVLCMAYIKSPLAGVLSAKEARKAYKNGSHSQVLVQFISLQGKILNMYSTNVDLTTTPVMVGRGFGASIREVSYLKNGIQLKNIAKYGFCLFYGDENKKDLLVFDASGKLRREEKIPPDANNDYLFTSSPNFYLLTRMIGYQGEEGNRLYIYSITDSTTEYRYDLKDKHGSWLKALTFDNDPVTGKAFIAGCIINPDRKTSFTTARDYSNAPYTGLFTINLGNTNKDIEGTYSYWNDEHMAGINRDGLFTDKSFYVKYATAFKDYNGNTVFTGAALIEKRLLGAAKYRLADGVFLVQDPKGHLKLDNSIPCDETSYFGPASSVLELDKKDFYKVVNSETKTNYIIIDDVDNTYIYNVNGKKVMRTIQHKDGRIKTRISPAKEGHIMVAEYNSKEKYTRLSIEAL
jgi:uncharacterized protein DUF6770